MKILLLDIETAPNTAHVWGLFDQNIAINQIQASGYTLCWTAKWLGSKELMFESVQDKRSPKVMLKRIHMLLDQADAVVHYNGKKFDIPTLNKEFVIFGMAPPSPYKQVDLYHSVRRAFRFPSNKLDYITQALGLGQKVRHPGHTLWTDCMKNDPAAWRKMEKYNRQDVKLLEKLYDRVLPWITNHPNVGAYDGITCCPNCGHTHLQHRGTAITRDTQYERYQCMSCAKWARGRTRQKGGTSVTLQGIS